MRFHDRRDAGRALAERLRGRQREGALPDPVVLALPRGGLPVADEIARALDAPLDVLVAHKIGAPYEPELAIGAVAGDDPPLYDTSARDWLGLDDAELAHLAERERAELRRRERLYRSGRPALDVKGCTAVVVDDGLATGLTAQSALRWARGRNPGRLVLAVPVGASQAAGALAAEADEVICLHQPSSFGAVGLWYDRFGQISDDEVLRVLRAAAERAAATRP